jgi:ribosomal protein S15P/S13E
MDSTVIPPLPEGFQLEQTESSQESIPPLPEGFQLETKPETVSKLPPLPEGFILEGGQKGNNGAQSSHEQMDNVGSTADLGADNLAGGDDVADSGISVLDGVRNNYRNSHEGLGDNPSPEDIQGFKERFPNVPLTKEHFKQLEAWKAQRPLLDKATDFLGDIGNAAVGVGKNVVNAGKEIVSNPAQAIKTSPATVTEGFLKGTENLADMAYRKPAAYLGDKAKELFSGATPDQQTDDSYQRYLKNMAWSQTLSGDSTADLLGQGARDTLGQANPATANALSLVLDPTVIATLGGSLIGKTLLKSAVESGVKDIGEGVAKAGLEQQILSKGGGAMEGAGKTLQSISEIPGNMAGKSVTKLTGDDLMGEKANAAVSGNTHGGDLALGIGLSHFMPGIAPFAFFPRAVQAARTLGKTVEGIGAFSKALAEKVAEGPSQWSYLERMAKDQNLAPWMQASARMLADYHFIEPAVQTAYGAVKGAGKGALIGGGLSAAGGGDSDEIGQGIGAGMALGAGSHLAIEAMSGAKKAALAKAGDAIYGFQKAVANGTDPAKLSDLSKTNPDLILQMGETYRLLGNNVDVRFLDQPSFMKAMPAGTPENVGGAYMTSATGKRPTVFVNLDKARAPGETLMHEVMHAIYDSPSTDKGQGKLLMLETYGEEGLRKMANQYAAKMLEGNQDVMMGRKSITPEMVQSQVNALRDNYNQNHPDGGELGWISDEALAEHMLNLNTWKSLSELRQGAKANGRMMPSDAKTTVERLKNGLGSVLGWNGPDGVPTPRTKLFSELSNDPRISQTLSNYVRDMDRYKPEIAKLKKEGAKVTPGEQGRNLGKTPAVEFYNDRGVPENDFATKNPDGTVAFKNPKEIKQKALARLTETNSMIPDEVLPANDPRFGRHKQADGEVVIGGKQLPDSFDRLSSFWDQTKAAARDIEQKMKTGETVHFWYQQVGSGADGDWTGSVKKDLGNLRVTEREVSPMAWKLSKKGNILLTALDVGSVRERMIKFHQMNQLDSLWGGNFKSFSDDMKTYLNNHLNGLPGETGIGSAKKDFLNAFFGAKNKATEHFNPLKMEDEFKGPSLVKSFRLDRMQNIQETGNNGWHFDWEKQTHNFKPEDYGIQEPEKQNREEILSKAGGGVFRPEDAYEKDRDTVDGFDAEDPETWPVPDALIARAQKLQDRLEEAPKDGSAQAELDFLKTKAQKIVNVLNERSPEKETPKTEEANPMAEMTREQKLAQFQKLPIAQQKELNARRVEMGREPLPTSEDAKAQFRPESDGFYSDLEDKLSAKMPARASVDQIRGIIKDAKPEEVKWSGLDDLLSKRTGPLTKEQVLQHIAENTPQFKEVTSTNNKYQDYQLPGGNNYREVVLALPEGKPTSETIKGLVVASKDGHVVSTPYKTEGEARARLLQFAQSNRRPISDYQIIPSEYTQEVAAKTDYTSNHFQDVPNYVAHMRLNDRMDSSGKPGTFIEELQSDRHQEGRDKGYVGDKKWDIIPASEWAKTSVGEKAVSLTEPGFVIVDKESGLSMLPEYGRQLPTLDAAVKASDRLAKKMGIPDAPFRKTWPVQMFKRALRDAVSSGKEWIGWTTGDTQSERYDLSKQVDQIVVGPSANDGLMEVMAFKGGNRVVYQPNIEPKDVASYVGKDLAKKALEQGAFDKNVEFKGDNLKVGGEGMKGFYDQILPKEIGAYVKKMGGKVEQSNLAVPEKEGTVQKPIWRVDITPEMKEKVSGGQALFRPEDTKLDSLTPEQLKEEASKMGLKFDAPWEPIPGKKFYQFTTDPSSITKGTTFVVNQDETLKDLADHLKAKERLFSDAQGVTFRPEDDESVDKPSKSLSEAFSKQGADVNQGTVAERPETIQEQMAMLLSGRKPVVMIPKGTDDPGKPQNIQAVVTKYGKFYFDPAQIDRKTIRHAVAEDRLGDILGYGISRKPELKDTVGAVVVRNAQGIEKFSVLSDIQHLRSVFASGQKIMNKGDSIDIENPLEILHDRTHSQNKVD